MFGRALDLGVRTGSELAEESLSRAGVGAAEECIRAHFVLLVDVEMELAGREEATRAERVIELLCARIEPGQQAGGVG